MEKSLGSPAPQSQSPRQGPMQKHFIAVNPSSLSYVSAAGPMEATNAGRSGTTASIAGASDESAIISHSSLQAGGRNEILITLDHQESRRRVPISPNLHTVGDAHSFLPAVPGPYDFVDECNDDARELDHEPLIIRGSARQGRIHQFLTAMKLGTIAANASTSVPGPVIVGPISESTSAISISDSSTTSGRRARLTRPIASRVPENASNVEDPRWNHSISSGSSDTSSHRCSRVSLEETPIKVPKFSVGIVLAALSCVFFATTSLIVKISSLHPMELLAARGYLQGLCVLPIAISSKSDLLGTNQNIRSLLLARGILGSASLIMSFISIHLIALADSSTLIFTSPVFVSIFACVCLGEACTWFDMLMIALTLTGVVFVSKPSFQFLNAKTDVVGGTSSWDGMVGSLCGLSAALFTALAFIILRQLKHIHYSVIILWFSVILAVFGTILTIALDAFTIPNDWCSIAQCLGVGLSGFLGQVLLTKALQIETATTVAIARTLDIVFAFLLQMLLLHDTPDVFSLLGSVLVVSCVVLTACRGRSGAAAKGVGGNGDTAVDSGDVVTGRPSTCSTVQLDQEDVA